MAGRRGARVVLASRNEADLMKIAKWICGEGGRAIAVPADVTKYEDVERLKDEAVEAFGGIDTWINNAATTIYGYLREAPLEEERQLFDSNFWGVRHGCRVAHEAMKDRGGVIINLGSEVSARAIPLQGMYSASKSAVKAYTDAFRMELEKENSPIRVCLVRPAGVDTPYTEHARNELHRGEPSIMPPVYHPNLVAEAILDCAVHPKREVHVGATSKLFDVIETIFPVITDYFMERVLFRGQSRGTKVPHKEEQEGLMHAPLREGRLTGGHKGRVHRRPILSSFPLFPFLTMTLAGAVVYEIARALKSGGQNRAAKSET